MVGSNAFGVFWLKYMRDIWNPWHGCIKKSPGCKNCYVYFLDKQRKQDASKVYRVKHNFDYPLHKSNNGLYKIKSGEQLRVGMTSDFFLAQADQWRDDAWEIIRKRSDVVFFLLTKRPERIKSCLPKTWGDGWENVFLNVSVENQEVADERIPILLKLPFKHKGIVAAPLLEGISIKRYLKTGKLRQVIASGEDYVSARPLNYEWVKSLYEECVLTKVTFNFFKTGKVFVKDGKSHYLNKHEQVAIADRLGLEFAGRPFKFKLAIAWQLSLF